MSTNSDKERELIRQAVLLHHEIRAQMDEKARQKSKSWAAMNSPFVVTLIGGALVTLITTGWTACSSHQQQQRTLREHEYERKVELYAKFAVEVQTNVVFFSEYLKKRQMYLLEFQHLPKVERPRYRDVYDYEEVSKTFDEERKAYFQMTPMKAQFGLVRGTYTSHAVQEAVNELDRVWEEMRPDTLSDQEEFERLGAQFQAAFEKTMVAMATELND